MSTQPDMILAFAHMVRDDFARRGVPGVRVYATTSEVSLNGRAPEPLVEVPAPVPARRRRKAS